MKSKLLTLLSLIVVVVCFILGIYVYPKMPDMIPSHWNIAGEVDGYMSKFWGTFLVPIISLGMFLLFILIPKLEPLRANLEKFKKYFDGFILVLMLFMLYVYCLTIAWTFGIRFNMGQMMMPALALIFYYCGVLISKAERNWFIGIRTPWTLSSDVVWKKTHKLGGLMFKIVALLALLASFLPAYGFYLVIFPIIAVAIFLMLYSYILYKKEPHNKID